MTKSKDNQDPETKTYGLKAAETNLLLYVQRNQQGIFSSILSTIALDRLAYPVTERTQFELTGDFTQIKLSEMPETEPTPEAEPESPIKTAS